tara:strand:+ start:123 stop:356 length:234 start_codon:yes stop_codon:yes gene_type:complete
MTKNSKRQKRKIKTIKQRKKLNKTKKIKGGAWSLKYKRSINCKKPKGFSQRQHCKYGRKKTIKKISKKKYPKKKFSK